MNQAAALLTFGAAGALLLVAWNRQQLGAAMGLDAPGADAAPVADWVDDMSLMMGEARAAVLSTSAADLTVSTEGAQAIKAREGLRLQRYRLGDGGWTIGYGRYFPDGGPVPPESIDRATAEAWFAEDLEQRGARWVRAYVTAPLTQHQFDSLVSMAYNLRPSSFKTIADAVNAGDDPEAQAMRYTRPGTNLEAGLRSRRAHELAMYRLGTYA